MEKEQIEESLHALFFDEGERIVFWNDAEQSFKDDFDDLDLGEVVKWRLDQHGPLSTKLEVERNRADSKFLLYEPFGMSAPQEDWLLDMRLYARPFSADRASLLRETLGLRNASIAEHLAKRLPFFKNKERLDKLGRIVQPNDAEEDIDLKIMSILSAAGAARVEDISLELFANFGTVFGDIGFDLDNKRWEKLQKFGMEDVYWRFVKSHWGYESKKPSLKDLFYHLTVTHLYQHLPREVEGEFPDKLRCFILPGGTARLNASVFITNWMQNAKKSNIYIDLAADIEVDLDLEKVLSEMNAFDLRDADTFEAIEKQIAAACLDLMQGGSETDFEAIGEVIAKRRELFWVGAENRSYAAVYDTFLNAIRIFSLRLKYTKGFKFGTPNEMYSSYLEDIYVFDQAYRHFHLAAGKVGPGLDMIKKDLGPAIEKLYCNWYLQESALSWDKLVEKSLLENWKIQDVDGQRSFYGKYVQPILDERETSTAFVIVSDALRYEVAEEINGVVSQSDRISGELNSMLGVLPSCTAMGMATLLPHREFDVSDDGVPVLDGRHAGSSNREAILKANEPNSITIRSDHLLGMTTQKGRELVKGLRVVYIYQDYIDAVGDKQATEESTFQAVEKTIEDLKRLVHFIHGCLNGNRILVTADHGFLFQKGELDTTDKSRWVEGGKIKESKKRYVVGRDLPAQEQAWNIPFAAIYGKNNGLEISIPKGIQKFHFAGGAKFVHGGLSLQEIVVPVIKFKGLKGKAAETGRASKVDLQLLDNTGQKITNNRQRFTFLQTDKVAGKKLPRTVRVGFYDSREELVSDEHTLAFDSTSDELGERQRTVLFTLKGGDYDKKTQYHMIMIDDESGMEYKRVPFTINLGIGNDFGGLL